MSPSLIGINRDWDVKDLEFSDDGNKLIFAAKLDVDPTVVGDIQTWDIYEYTISTKTLRRVMPAIEAVLGDDISPHYLLNGRIIFSSTLNQTTQAVLAAQLSTISTQAPVTEGSGGGGASFKLHVMESDGSGIHQVSFGTSHDLFPSMMRTGPYSGKIIFSRWDTKAVPGTSDFGMHLYMINPDGTDEQYIYGRQSHATGTNGDTIQFTKPWQLQDGRILALIRHNTGTFDGGDLAVIDINNYVDNMLPTKTGLAAGLTGPAQSSISAGLASTNTGITSTGKFNSVYPYYDGTNRVVVSYSQCYVNVPGQTDSLPCDGKNEKLTGATAAAPRYYVAVYTLGSNLMPFVTTPEPGFYYTDVAVAQDKTSPTYIPDVAGTGKKGKLHLRKVNADYPTAAYVRIYKHTYLDNTVTNIKIGIDTSRKMREIIGYAPIQADGSVRVEVPANVPLSIQLVNSNYENIGPEHPEWFTVRPDEERVCNGCHVAGKAHGRTDAEDVSNPGTTLAQVATAGNPITMRPIIDYSGMDTSSLVNISTCTIQSSWDGNCRVIINYNLKIQPLWAAKGCISCHVQTTDSNGNPVPPPNGFDLTITGENAGEPTNYTAYRNVYSRVTPGNAMNSTFFANNRFGAGGSHETRLTAGEIKLIKEWIDIGAQYQNQP
ncbi:MAG: hypothetical protein HY080_13820 [Gammaproteobacteria bacterium]|nr:hypothetical protein [Gammaproteobacteria bacterium]